MRFLYRKEKPVSPIWSTTFLIVLFLLGCGPSNFGDSASEGASPALTTGLLRAAYVPYPPGCIKDPNSGELSGIFVETLQAAAKSLELELRWTEEVGWGTMIEGLRTRRYDVVGSPVWANSSRARHVAFTVPLFYSGIGVYVRQTEHRFTKIQELNSPSVRLATMDGEMSLIIAQSQFPKAKSTSITQLSDVSQLLLEVAEGKADATFVEPFVAKGFLESNPGSVRNMVPSDPVRVFPNTMLVHPDDAALLRMLNVALEEQINSGAVLRLLTKYGAGEGSLYPVARPYGAP